MELYCRLCAKLKPNNALKCKLSDVRWKLEQCCIWEESDTENAYPQNVCRTCFNQLEKSWQFFSAVKIAQKEIKILIAPQRGMLQRTDPLDTHKIDTDNIIIKHEPAFEIDASINVKLNVVIASDEDDNEDNSAKGARTDNIGGNFNAGKNHDSSEDDFDDGDDSGAENCVNDDNCSEDGIGDDDTAASKQRAGVSVPEYNIPDVSDRKNFRAEDHGTIKSPENEYPQFPVDVKPHNLSHKTTYTQNEAGSAETKAVKIFDLFKGFVEKKEFLHLIPENARLENGEIDPEKIAELNLVDWADIKYNCSKCPTSCDTEISLRAHFDDKHPETNFELMCSICAMNKINLTKDTSHTFKNLQMHITKSHYPHLYYCCFKCHVYFWDRKKMRRHLNRVPHANRRAEPLLCQICSKIFTNEQSLTKHLKYIHEKSDRQFECHLCKKALKSSMSLNAHMRSLHVSFKKDEKKVCATCGRICNSASALYSHMYSHNPVDAVSCDICQKTFKSKNRLKIHKMTHKLVKDLVCDNCDYRTRIPHQLVLHKRTHTDFKPYECDVCLKRFRHSGVLKIHKRTHTGDKPFVCSFCDYRSTCKQNIIKHKQRKHKTEIGLILDDMQQ